MKIKSIRKIGTRPVYDITVGKSHEYILKNGVITHNTGPYYSADNIWILGRQQDKETSGDKELVGWNFVINIEKSRYAKEKTKISINVNFDTGINKWSGLLDNAVEFGVVTKALPGKYSYVDNKGEEHIYKEKDIIASDKFWKQVLSEYPDLKTRINEKYSSGTAQLNHDEEEIKELTFDDIDDEVEDLGEIL